MLILGTRTVGWGRIFLWTCPHCWLNVPHLQLKISSGLTWGSCVLVFQLYRTVSVVHEGWGVPVISSAHCKRQHQTRTTLSLWYCKTRWELLVVVFEEAKCLWSFLRNKLLQILHPKKYIIIQIAESTNLLCWFIKIKCAFVLYFPCAEIRELNELYKKCVTHCRSLNHQLQTFLLNKQRLMDRFMGITAEKLLYSHAVHMVSSPHSSGGCWHLMSCSVWFAS